MHIIVAYAENIPKHIHVKINKPYLLMRETICLNIYNICFARVATALLIEIEKQFLFIYLHIKFTKGKQLAVLLIKKDFN